MLHVAHESAFMTNTCCALNVAGRLLADIMMATTEMRAHDAAKYEISARHPVTIHLIKLSS